MVIEADQGQWLLAKARQLKERALGTADRTRRKQFLLIATEYQKLVAPTNNVIEFSITKNVTEDSRRGVIAYLRLDSVAPTHPQAPVDEAEQVQQRSHLIYLVVLTVVTLAALTLVLVPGDQTEDGLRTLIGAIFN